LPPSNPPRPRKPAKKRPGSIRDAAANAAGSVPAPASPAAPVPIPPPAPRVRTRRSSEERPTFPDPDTPATSWDPWDQTIEGPPGDEARFDPNRTLGDWLEAVIPAEAQVHFIRAGQEFAAGVQTTVDHHLGRREAGDAIGGTTRIEIE